MQVASSCGARGSPVAERGRQGSKASAAVAHRLPCTGVSLVAQLVKNLPAMQET